MTIPKTYYIVFETKKSQNFSIRTTLNDMDSSEGLLNEINSLEKEHGTNVIITYWKELNKKWSLSEFLGKLIL